LEVAFGSRRRNSAPLPWTTWTDQLKASITTSAVRTFCGTLKSGLGEDNGRLSNGEQVNRLAALSLKRGKSVDFGCYWQRHWKDVHA
jgi:hypothetical protein